MGSKGRRLRRVRLLQATGCPQLRNQDGSYRVHETLGGNTSRFWLLTSRLLGRRRRCLNWTSLAMTAVTRQSFTIVYTVPCLMSIVSSEEEMSALLNAFHSRICQTADKFKDDTRRLDALRATTPVPPILSPGPKRHNKLILQKLLNAEFRRSPVLSHNSVPTKPTASSEQPQVSRNSSGTSDSKILQCDEVGDTTSSSFRTADVAVGYPAVMKAKASCSKAQPTSSTTPKAARSSSGNVKRSSSSQCRHTRISPIRPFTLLVKNVSETPGIKTEILPSTPTVHISCDVHHRCTEILGLLDSNQLNQEFEDNLDSATVKAILERDKESSSMKKPTSAPLLLLKPAFDKQNPFLLPIAREVKPTVEQLTGLPRTPPRTASAPFKSNCSTGAKPHASTSVKSVVCEHSSAAGQARSATAMKMNINRKLSGPLLTPAAIAGPSVGVKTDASCTSHSARMEPLNVSCVDSSRAPSCSLDSKRQLSDKIFPGDASLSKEQPSPQVISKDGTKSWIGAGLHCSCPFLLSGKDKYEHSPYALSSVAKSSSIRPDTKVGRSDAPSQSCRSRPASSVCIDTAASYTRRTAPTTCTSSSKALPMCDAHIRDQQPTSTASVCDTSVRQPKPTHGKHGKIDGTLASKNYSFRTKQSSFRSFRLKTSVILLSVRPSLVGYSRVRVSSLRVKTTTSNYPVSHSDFNSNFRTVSASGSTKHHLFCTCAAHRASSVAMAKSLTSRSSAPPSKPKWVTVAPPPAERCRNSGLSIVGSPNLSVSGTPDVSCVRSLPRSSRHGPLSHLPRNILDDRAGVGASALDSQSSASETLDIPRQSHLQNMEYESLFHVVGKGLLRLVWRVFARR